jgi:hypothetical protein
MLMNPELQGIATTQEDDLRPPAKAVTPKVSRPLSSTLRRARFLMTLLPVPLYCAFEALFGVETLHTLWFLVLTPVAMLWYAVDYFLNNSLVRRILKEVAHYGLFLTPAVTLFVAGLQPAGEGWPLAKTMLFWGEFTCCCALALVLWQDRRQPAR